MDMEYKRVAVSKAYELGMMRASERGSTLYAKKADGAIIYNEVSNIMDEAIQDSKLETQCCKLDLIEYLVNLTKNQIVDTTKDDWDIDENTKGLIAVAFVLLEFGCSLEDVIDITKSSLDILIEINNKTQSGTLFSAKGIIESSSKKIKEWESEIAELKETIAKTEPTLAAETWPNIVN